jgi:hypothetical protein
LQPRWTSRRRSRRAGPDGSRGSGRKGGKSLLVPAAWRPSTAASRRGSDHCYRRCLLPATLWESGPSFPRNVHATNGQGRPDGSCSGGGGSGRGRKGRQVLLVAAAQRAAALAGHRRRRRWARGLLPAPFRADGYSFLWGTLTSGARTSEGRHGRIAL